MAGSQEVRTTGFAWWCVACLCMFLFVSGATLWAQTTVGIDRFRVDNIVQMEQDDKLVKIETSTIFSDGLVFDFIGDYGEIIIYRQDTSTFTLLDPIHRVQTELTMDSVDEFLERIKKRLEEKDDKFCRFIVSPQFEKSKNEDGGELLFQSKFIDYEIKTKPFEQKSFAKEFFLFSNAYSKLNIYLNPGTTTPFARLAINEDLEQLNLFPESFHTNVYPKGKWLFSKSIKIESRHNIVRRLSEKDHGRIMRALHFAQQFPKMPFGDYQKAINVKK